MLYKTIKLEVKKVNFCKISQMMYGTNCNRLVIFDGLSCNRNCVTYNLKKNVYDIRA
jgi:hypothetical protein